MVDNENLFMIKEGLLSEISIKRDLSVKLSISVRVVVLPLLRLFTAFEATTTHTTRRVENRAFGARNVFSGSAFSIDISVVELGGDTGVNASVCPSKLLRKQPCCFGLYKVD